MSAVLKKIPLSFSPISLSANSLISLCLLFILFFDNGVFWSSLMQISPPGDPANIVLYLAVFAFIFSFLFILVTPFSQRYLLKPVLILLILIAAMSGYYMESFGTVFDKSMIQNIARTDIHESTELLDFQLLIHLVLYAFIPIFFITRVQIKKQAVKKEIKQRFIMLTALLVFSTTVIYAAYKDLTFVFREHRTISFMINPLYPIVSAYKYSRDQLRTKPPYEAVFSDAHQQPVSDKKSVFVLVVGETARAENFQLNGYSRKTNPNLSQKDIVNYSQVSSCGTATAISVPCMFSWLDHDNFSNAHAENSDNILDAFKHAGIEVLWEDNNAGCQGVCNNIPYKSLSHIELKDYCNQDGCFDDILLKNLSETIKKAKGDLLIVLHQQGSHGPAYYRRYPEAFAKFLPECRTSAVQNCSNQEISNAYDNTILYTDHFLSGLIDLLDSIHDTATAMLYISDHGESLGEKGVYLHGLPYFMAPSQQTHVPMIVWMSEPFKQSKAIDESCMKNQSRKPISQDYISHSVLGVMDIVAKKYNPDLDIFASCRGENIAMKHQADK